MGRHVQHTRPHMKYAHTLTHTHTFSAAEGPVKVTITSSVPSEADATLSRHCTRAPSSCAFRHDSNNCCTESPTHTHAHTHTRRPEVTHASGSWTGQPNLERATEYVPDMCQGGHHRTGHDCREGLGAQGRSVPCEVSTGGQVSAVPCGGSTASRAEWGRRAPLQPPQRRPPWGPASKNGRLGPCKRIVAVRGRAGAHHSNRDAGDSDVLATTTTTRQGQPQERTVESGTAGSTANST